MLRTAVFLLAAAGGLAGQGFRPQMGVEVDGLGDAARARPFVNHARLFRTCTRAGASGAAPTDANGWPTVDAGCVLFDIRPIPAWAPPIDDPKQFQPDWSGVWKISFEGKADLALPSGGARIENAKYDEGSGSTTADMVVSKGTGLVSIEFRNTDGGFRNFRLIRPGYEKRAKQVFTDEFLTTFSHFQHVRYMDWSKTNDNTPSNNPQDRLEWRDRHLTTDATQADSGRKRGAAWEFAILLANQTATDMWINIPVAASDDYIRELARLIRAKLNPSLKVYIEHGNEVWNPLFANSYNFNRNAATAEVAAGSSKLNADGTSSLDNWAVRRHLRRVAEAVGIFREEFAEPARIRGVFAWWTIFPDRYVGALKWFQSNIGEPKDYLYGVAQTHYYNVNPLNATASAEDLLATMTRSSDNGMRYDDILRQAAKDYGLKHMIYEGGPDVGGGSTTNVGNRIEANRLAAMKDLVIRDMKANFFDRGGSEYTYFSHCGPCSRFGCWGATEDIVDLKTPKWEALRELAAVPEKVRIDAVANAATGGAEIAPGTVIAITGDKLAPASYLYPEGMLESGPGLPTMLGGVQVRVGGSPVAVRYVDEGLIQAILPADMAVAGETTLDIVTRNGSHSGTIALAAVAPGLFAPQKPGRGGESVDLYATGLGATDEPAPANEALARGYAFGDLARVKVRIGGREAAAGAVELVDAGLYRVSVVLPKDLAPGDQPVVLTVDGVASNTVALSYLRE